MPKLLHFIPCEKIIKHEGEDAISLMTVLEGATVNLIEDVAPETIHVPLRWAIFTHWLLNHDEEGGRYTQYLHLIAPDETPLIQNRTTFELKRGEHTVWKIATMFDHFPAPVPGIYWIMLALQTGNLPIAEGLTTGVPLVIRHNRVRSAQPPAEPEPEEGEAKNEEGAPEA